MTLLNDQIQKKCLQLYLERDELLEEIRVHKLENKALSTRISRKVKKI
jgi:hypothetical protein